MAEDEINKLKEKNDDELKLIESNLEKSEIEKKTKITIYDNELLDLETNKVHWNDKLISINN